MIEHPAGADPRIRHSLRATFAFALGLFVAALPAAAAGTRLDDETAASGLKEALGIGTTRAVETLGRLDGYLGNPEVRIPMPERMESLGRALRKIGQDELVDELETSMNRAAEAAAPLAKDVFLTAIKGMTFRDAVTIVRGSGHEATDYLIEHAGPELGERFRPIVGEQLDSVGATRAFNDFMRRTERLPFVDRPAVDLSEHVTSKAIDGLFLMIAREEEKIRKDPLARTTDLLRTVFGGDTDEQEEKRPWWKRVLSRDS